MLGFGPRVSGSPPLSFERVLAQKVQVTKAWVLKGLGSGSGFRVLGFRV